MLNNNIITILKSANTITDKVILKYPVTVVNSPSADIYMRVDTSILDEDKFEDIGIYELSEFLNVFSLYSEDRIVKQDNAIITVSDSSSVSTYVTSEIDLMNDFNKAPIMFEKTKAVDTVCEFELTKEILKKVKNASGVYKTLKDLNLISMDSELTLELSQNNTFASKSNSHKINVNASCSKEFKVSLPIVNFISLPVNNYTAYVKYNANANAYRFLLVSKDIPGMEIIMSTNA